MSFPFIPNMTLQRAMNSATITTATTLSFSIYKEQLQPSQLVVDKVF